jgi:hypothetical protein
MVNFSGVLGGYDLLPAALHLVDLPSPADQRTLLVANRVGGNLGIGSSTLGTLFGVIRDDEENDVIGFSASGASQLFLELSDQSLATAPPLSQAIPAGRTGWLAIFNQTAAIGVTGVALFAAPAPEASDEITSSRQLPLPPERPPSPFATGAVTLTPATFTTAAYTVPVVPPGC